MYPNNIKSEKISKVKVLKTNLKSLKDETKSLIKYIWDNRKQLSKIIMVKLHV